MSAFEKLPLELRSHIYRYCLIHHGKINPFPTEHERAEDRLAGVQSAQRVQWSGGRHQPHTVDSSQQGGSQHYAEHWPCIALLGVNKEIRNEAAWVLFGNNTWMFSLPYGDDGTQIPKMKRFYYNHRRWIRDVVMRFDMRDISQTMFLEKKRALLGIMNVDGTHDHYAILQRDEWSRLLQLTLMNGLTRLTIDLSTLRCPLGCCRFETVKSFRDFLFKSTFFTGKIGIWSAIVHVWLHLDACPATLFRSPISQDAIFKIVGLEDEDEKALFREVCNFQLD